MAEQQNDITMDDTSHQIPQDNNNIEQQTKDVRVLADIPPEVPPRKRKGAQLDQDTTNDQLAANTEVHSDSGDSVAKQQEMMQSNNNNRGSIDLGELPPTPPEEWETSEDRLGGKLYTVVKDFRARFDFQISVKKGELVELTEIDSEDKSWHVRVTLGTSMDGYLYTKRVGWVPAEYFEEFTGLDRRKKSQSLLDVSDFTLQNSGGDSVPLKDTGDTLDVFDAMYNKRLSRSISDLSDVVVMRTSKSRRHMNTSRSIEVADTSLYRRTGSWLGGSDVHHHLGHRFQASSLHIPVRCSFCKKWCGFHNQEVCEYQCLNCKLVVHKGCHVKVLTQCRLYSEEVGDWQDNICHSVYDENVHEEHEDGRLSIDLPHRFRVHTWKTPTRCSHCSGFIVGIVRQGLKCSECSANIHHKCKPNVANSCSTKLKEIADKLHEVKEREDERKEEEHN